MGSADRSSNKDNRNNGAKKNDKTELEARLADLAAAHEAMQRLKPKKDK